MEVTTYDRPLNSNPFYHRIWNFCKQSCLVWVLLNSVRFLFTFRYLCLLSVHNWLDTLALTKWKCKHNDSPMSEFRHEAAIHNSSSAFVFPEFQLVWGDTNLVGCGFTYYQDPKLYSKLYVCNYGPGWVGDCNFALIYLFVINLNLPHIAITMIDGDSTSHIIPNSIDVHNPRRISIEIANIWRMTRHLLFRWEKAWAVH